MAETRMDFDCAVYDEDSLIVETIERSPKIFLSLKVSDPEDNQVALTPQQAIALSNHLRELAEGGTPNAQEV